jgi:hypothetical protein
MKALGAEPGSIRSLFLMETGLSGWAESPAC